MKDEKFSKGFLSSKSVPLLINPLTVKLLKFSFDSSKIGLFSLLPPSTPMKIQNAVVNANKSTKKAKKNLTKVIATFTSIFKYNGIFLIRTDARKSKVNKSIVITSKNFIAAVVSVNKFKTATKSVPKAKRMKQSSSLLEFFLM